MGWLKNAGNNNRFPAQKEGRFCPHCGQWIGGSRCTSTACEKRRKAEAVEAEKAASAEKERQAQKAKAKRAKIKKEREEDLREEAKKLAPSKAAFSLLSKEEQKACCNCIEWSQKLWTDPELAPNFQPKFNSALDWAEHIT